jgi:hypothetical protein
VLDCEGYSSRLLSYFCFNGRFRGNGILA